MFWYFFGGVVVLLLIVACAVSDAEQVWEEANKE